MYVCDICAIYEECCDAGPPYKYRPGTSSVFQWMSNYPQEFEIVYLETKNKKRVCGYALFALDASYFECVQRVDDVALDGERKGVSWNRFFFTNGSCVKIMLTLRTFILDKYAEYSEEIFLFMLLFFCFLFLEAGRCVLELMTDVD